MKTSEVSSRGEFKTSGGLAFVEVAATVGVFETGGGFAFVEVTATVGVFETGGGFAFVEVTATVGVFVGGMSRSHAARNDAARTNEDVFRKSRREESLFI